MVKTTKMDALRALVGECLSAAAEEIFTIVARIITEHDEDGSQDHRLLDVDKPYTEDQRCSAVTNASRSWEPASSTDNCSNLNNTHLDSFTTCENDQKIPIDSEEVDAKQENDLNVSIKKLFKCHVCWGDFSSQKTLERHIKKHSEEKSSLYQCQFCERCFNDESQLISHSGIHEDADPYKCQDGAINFDKKDDLLVHMQNHTEEKSSQWLSDAEMHPSSVTPARQSELDGGHSDRNMSTFPLRITRDRRGFDQESLQPLSLYQMQTVSDIDKDASDLVPVHIKSESITDKDTDDQLFPSVNLPNLGGSEAEPKRPNVKTFCPGRETFSEIQVELGAAPKPYRCPSCAKCFSLTKTLMRHLKIHMEEKPYQCQLCGRIFCQKSDLVNHTRIHTGERPYQCQECHKTFPRKCSLVVHMRTHAGE